MTTVGGLEPHWIWLIVAVALGIAELLVPGVFLIWLAAAAALTGLAALILGIPLAFQFALFALLAIGSVYLGRRWYANNPVESSDPLLNERGQRLIGKTVIVVEPVDEHRGRVRIGDSEWSARGGPAGAGEQVRIVAIDGNCLRVEGTAALPPA
jgi:membrane protein implicated in regulation of membrane protease activity